MQTPELHSNLLLPPNDAIIETTDTSVAWFEPSGIYCSVGLKKVKQMPFDEMKYFVEEWKKQFDNKVCMLSVVDGTQQTDKATRDYIATILPGVIKALSLVAESALARMASNLFFRINKQDYPVKVFTDVDEARKWLTQYL